MSKYRRIVKKNGRGLTVAGKEDWLCHHEVSFKYISSSDTFPVNERYSLYRESTVVFLTPWYPQWFINLWDKCILPKYNSRKRPKVFIFARLSWNCPEVNKVPVCLSRLQPRSQRLLPWQLKSASCHDKRRWDRGCLDDCFKFLTVRT